jgi:hypothetical protein
MERISMSTLQRFLTTLAAVALCGGSLLAAPAAASAAGCNTAATGSWSNNCTVSEGASSHMVEVIQMIVQSQEVCNGIVGNVDGVFGPKTFAGVECYQRFFGLHVDGIVGPQTWGTMGARLTKCSASGGWQYWATLFPCPGVNGGVDPIADWISTGKWYFLSPISHTWQRMNTSPPS